MRLMMRIIESFLRYAGYLIFINDPISCFIANSSSCTNSELFLLLTSCLTAIKKCYKKCKTSNKRNGKIYLETTQ